MICPKKCQAMADLSLDDLLQEVEGAITELPSPVKGQSSGLALDGYRSGYPPPADMGGSRAKCMTPSSLGASSPMAAAPTLGSSRSVPSLQPVPSDPNSPRNLVPHRPNGERRPSNNQATFNPKQKFVHAPTAGGDPSSTPPRLSTEMSSSGSPLQTSSSAARSPLGLAPSTGLLASELGSLPLSSPSPTALARPGSAANSRPASSSLARGQSPIPSPLPSPTFSEIDSFTDSLLAMGTPSPIRTTVNKPPASSSAGAPSVTVSTGVSSSSSPSPMASAGIASRVGGTTASMSPSAAVPNVSALLAAKKKCAALFLGGADAKVGYCTSSTVRSACDSLRCTACDFNVMRFAQRKWRDDVDYMFLRNNMPDAQKLSVRLQDGPGMSAYSCQCSWRSVQDYTRIMPSGDLRWVCGGHQA